MIRRAQILAWQPISASPGHWLVRQGPRFRIGRALENDLVIDAVAFPMVSRFHLECRFTPQGWMLIPGPAANGTWVDGRPVVGSIPIEGKVAVVLGMDGPTVHLHSAPEAIVEKAGLAVARADEGPVALYEDNRIEVGRDVGLPMSFPNVAEVSRMHAHLVRDAAGLQVVDSNSGNGVTVDGKRIQGSARLREGARVGFGAKAAEVRVAIDPRRLCRPQRDWGALWQRIRAAIDPTSLRSHRSKQAVSLLLLLILGWWLWPRDSSSPTAILSQRYSHSVGMVCMELSVPIGGGAVDIGTGTCFLVGRQGSLGFLVTNAHVADPRQILVGLARTVAANAQASAGSREGEGADPSSIAAMVGKDDGELFACMAGQGKALQCRFHVVFHDRAPIEARWLGSHPTADLALMVADLGSSDAEPLDLLPERAEVAGTLYAMGYSNGIEGLVPMMSREEQEALEHNPGRVVELLTRIQQRDGKLLIPPVRECLAIQRSASTLRFTGQLGHGHSGGPVVDVAGRVVGVVASGRGEALDDKYAVTSDVVRELAHGLGLLSVR